MQLVKLFFRSWIDSIKIFSPKNFVEFLYVSFKGLKDVPKLFFKYFLPRFLILFVPLAFYSLYFDYCPIASTSLFILFVVSVICWMLYKGNFIYLDVFLFLSILILFIFFRYYWSEVLVFLYILEIILFLLIVYYFLFLISSMRPSVDIKNNYYFSLQLSMLFAILIITFMVSFNFILVLKFLLSQMIGAIYQVTEILLRFLMIDLSVEGVVPLLQLTYFLSSYIIFLILFTLDSQKKVIELVKVPGKAFLMFIYNYPFCFIIYWLAEFLFLGLRRVIFYFQVLNPMILTVIWWFSIFLIYSFYLSLIVNFYIKQIHEKFTLYYKSK